MINKVLTEYLYNINSKKTVKHKNRHGPVITISRECGCHASEIAEKLALALTKQKKLESSKDVWTWLNKEILSAAAKKLEIHPHKIKHVFNAEEKPFLEDIITSFFNGYISVDIIKKTITKIVKLYAETGNVIIVGRAGSVITEYIPDAIHIKLIAPINWRTENFCRRYNLSGKEAKKIIINIDKNREKFKKFFKKNKDDKNYHAIFNRNKLSTDEIVEQILFLAKQKNIC